MLIKEVMNKKPIQTNPETSIREATRIMTEPYRKFGCC